MPIFQVTENTKYMYKAQKPSTLLMPETLFVQGNWESKARKKEEETNMRIKAGWAKEVCQ